MQKNEQRVIIVGGGFAGIKTAKELARSLPQQVQITLISDKEYFEYYPGLYRLVTGASPVEACVPLSDMLPSRVEIITDRVVSVDTHEKTVTGISGTVYQAKYLVLALGSKTAYFDIPGIEKNSYGFKSVEEALTLKHHIYELFNAKHSTETKESCLAQFHIVIVGGGASGVEIAGDLAAFTHELAKKYHIDQSLISIDIIESSPRILSTLDPKVSKKALEQLRRLGVNVYLNRTLVKEELETIYLKDMAMNSKTLIWTAGTQVHPLYKTIESFETNKKGRISVNNFLEAKNSTDIFILGDAADTPYAGLAQTALYDGEYVSYVINCKIRNLVAKPYKPKPVTYAIPIGKGWGILAMKHATYTGLFAYVVRHMIDLIFFAGMVNIKKLLTMYYEGFKYRKLEAIYDAKK